jgi:gas vesicle protein
MHLSSILVAVLIGGAIAAPTQLIERDSSVADAAFKRILKSMTKLDDAMKKRPRDGDEADARKISNNFIELAKEGMDEVRFSTREVRRGPAISQSEAIKLALAIPAIGDTFKSITKGWIDSKDMIVLAGLKKQIKALLVEGSEGLIGFTEAVITKLPKIDQKMAQLMKTAFVDVLEPAISTYGGWS